MPQVKVRRRNISTDEAAAAIRSKLGDSVQISPDGEREVRVKKSYFAQAKVSMSEDPGGTVFDVSGAASASLPLWMLTMKMVNDRGIARQVAAAIGEYKNFADDA
jgi:hypothetical protein